MANENEEIKVTDERADDRIAVHIREQSTNFNSPSCCAVEVWCGLNGPDVVGEGLEFGRRAGYTAAANETAASQDLNVCSASMGVHFAEYDLASYLSSWMARPTTPISSATLTRFRRQLGQYFLREQDHRFAYEMATTLAVRYPAMFTSETGISNAPAAGSEASAAQQTCFGFKPHQTTQDFPVWCEMHDWYVPDLDYVVEQGSKRRFSSNPRHYVCVPKLLL